MFALPPEADTLIVGINVCYLPVADLNAPPIKPHELNPRIELMPGRCEELCPMYIESHEDLHRRHVLCGGGAFVFAAMIAFLLGGSKPVRAQTITGGVPEVDRVSVRVVIDSYQFAVAAGKQMDSVDVQHFGWGLSGDKPPDRTLISEFGLSMHAESKRGHETRNLLMDRPSTASNRNKTAKTRPAFRPITSGIGRLNMAARARGHAAAIAAVTSGTATNNPMTGKGFEIAIIPADPAAAAMPIQTPASAARVNFALCETSMNVMTALTAITISAKVTMKPRKSSI